jgi:enolase
MSLRARKRSYSVYTDRKGVMKIVKVLGREIYDSRGWPTLSCEIWLDSGLAFTGYAPAGISCSKYEAREMRDGDKRLWGRGVQKACAVLEQVIAPALVGKEPEAPDLDLTLIELDGTLDKSHLGSNVLVAASMALYKAYAYQEHVELFELFAYMLGANSVTLPCPQFNVINGGKHANNNLSIQEFMIAPIGSPTLASAIETCITVYHELRDLLQGRGKFVGIGDEGGFTAQFKDDREALDILFEAIERVALSDIGICAIALDVAASQLYDATQQKYMFNNRSITAAELINFYSELVQTYPIYSIEDGLSEDDWEGWKSLTETLGDKVQIVGDDIFATNPERISHTLQNNVATAVVVKPNQIGTVTEALQVINLCRENQLSVVVSHRSGETDDPFIADLAVGVSASQIKAGGCSRSERLSKYNRLIAIEDTLTLNRHRL